MAVDKATAKKWQKEDKAKENGKPDVQEATITFNPQEFELLYNVISQASFPSAMAKQVAASIQIKLEQAAQAVS